MRSARMTKPRRQYAHNLISVIVQADGAAENIPIPAEVAAPKAVADDRGGRVPGRIILGAKQPSNLRNRAQHGKVVGAGGDHLQALCLRASAQIDAAALGASHVFEYTRPI